MPLRLRLDPGAIVRGPGILRSVDTGTHPNHGVFVAADVHYLDPDGRPGLGARAREESGVPVIGVAKPAFRTATHASPVLRGTSTRPLYVTVAGIPRADAADLVRHMAGQHRSPDALRRADNLARHGLPQSPRR